MIDLKFKSALSFFSSFHVSSFHFQFSVSFLPPSLPSSSLVLLLLSFLLLFFLSFAFHTDRGRQQAAYVKDMYRSTRPSSLPSFSLQPNPRSQAKSSLSATQPTTTTQPLSFFLASFSFLLSRCSQIWMWEEKRTTICKINNNVRAFCWWWASSLPPSVPSSPYPFFHSSCGGGVASNSLTIKSCALSPKRR